MGSCELFAWGWLWTSVLLISAFWVAGITVMRHHRFPFSTESHKFCYIVFSFSFVPKYFLGALGCTSVVEYFSWEKCVFFVDEWSLHLSPNIYVRSNWLTACSNPQFFSSLEKFFWTQGLTLSRQTLYHLSHSTNPILWWFFSKHGFMNYLPWAGFKPWSFWSLPPA
jgi:hypothetical protein